ncbi:cellulose biosynthesis protein BcsN [Methylobacterium sp. ID0610]|uniref:cellulose biosynthesis protein BcsN n=1 Tax=Methylobacterium carpenticola TaxID=3344827 RepID=UPI003688D539
MRHIRVAAAAGLIGLPALAAQAQPAPALHLPGAGRITGVEEIRVRDGFDQHIRFEGGDGRNRAEIGLRTETGDLLLAFPPRLAKPNELGIAGELAARFPGQIMRVVTTPHRNVYGPIGLALGADCLYAWQWFERGPAGGTRQQGLFGVASAARQALSLRIRLCRTARASLGDLLRAVESMRIALPRAPGATEVPARSAPARRIAKPRPRPAPPAAAPAPPRVTPAPVRPAPAEPAEPPQQRPAPSPPPAPPANPPVPAPGDSSGGGRRYIAPAAPATPAPSPEATTPGGSQRYITDGLTPQPAPGRAPGESLSPDLPSEAYRPPATRTPPP